MTTTLQFTKQRKKLKKLVDKALAFAAFGSIAVTTLVAKAGPLSDAEGKSKTAFDKITLNNATGAFDGNAFFWGIITVMMIVGIAISVGFAAFGEMGGQRDWKDHVWTVMGATAPKVFSILAMAGLIAWIAA